MDGAEGSKLGKVRRCIQVPLFFGLEEWNGHTREETGLKVLTWLDGAWFNKGRAPSELSKGGHFF
jgi:hypothetical protein